MAEMTPPPEFSGLSALQTVGTSVLPTTLAEGEYSDAVGDPDNPWLVGEIFCGS
jgi:hypothetical protein